MNLLSFNLYQLIDRHKYNYLIYNKQVGGGGNLKIIPDCLSHFI